MTCEEAGMTEGNVGMTEREENNKGVCYTLLLEREDVEIIS